MQHNRSRACPPVGRLDSPPGFGFDNTEPHPGDPLAKDRVRRPMAIALYPHTEDEDG